MFEVYAIEDATAGKIIRYIPWMDGEAQLKRVLASEMCREDSPFEKFPEDFIMHCVFVGDVCDDCSDATAVGSLHEFIGAYVAELRDRIAQQKEVKQHEAEAAQ